MHEWMNERDTQTFRIQRAMEWSPGRIVTKVSMQTSILIILEIIYLRVLAVYASHHSTGEWQNVEPRD